MWSFYDRPMQPVIKEMFDITMENVGSKWKYNYLSYNNLSLFLNTSSFPRHFYRLLPAHQSDYLRMLLLEKYGGWWIDTALIINDNNVMEEFYKEIVEKKAEFFGVCNVQCPRKLVENGFIYAPKGSIVIKKWKEEMELIHMIGQKNYIYNTYREGVTFPSLVFGYTYPYVDTYMTAFVAEQKVFDRLIPRNTSIIIKGGKNTIYAFNRYCKRNKLNYKDIYFDKEKRKTFPLIKINSWLRRKIFTDQDTVTAFGKKYDNVKLMVGSKGYEKRLNYMIIESIIYIVVIVYVEYFYKFIYKLIKFII